VILSCCYVFLAVVKQLPTKQGTMCGDKLLLEEKEDKGIDATRELLSCTAMVDLVKTMTC
jgi:hypothetical protein